MKTNSVCTWNLWLVLDRFDRKRRFFLFPLCSKRVLVWLSWLPLPVSSTLCNQHFKKFFFAELSFKTTKINTSATPLLTGDCCHHRNHHLFKVKASVQTDKTHIHSIRSHLRFILINSRPFRPRFEFTTSYFDSKPACFSLSSAFNYFLLLLKLFYLFIFIYLLF